MVKTIYNLPFKIEVEQLALFFLFEEGKECVIFKNVRAKVVLLRAPLFVNYTLQYTFQH